MNTDSAAAKSHQRRAFSGAAAAMNSWQPIMHSSDTSSAVAQSGAKHSTPSSAGMPMTATKILCFIGEVSSFNAAETAVALLIVDDGLIQLGAGEVGP